MTIHLGWSTLLWAFAVVGAGVVLRTVFMAIALMFMDWIPPWRRY